MEMKSPPIDRRHFVYIVFLLGGIATLLPWNFFITAIKYFEYKLKDRLPNGTLSSIKSDEEKLFGNYLSLCSLLPLSLTNILSLFLMNLVPLMVRYVAGSSVVCLVMVITASLTMATLAKQVFLGITLATVVIVNIATAFLQNSVIAYASFMPETIMKATLEGQALAGIMASLARIISLLVAGKVENSALAYFLFAVVFLVAFTVLFILAKRQSPFFRYYTELAQSGDEEKVPGLPESQNHATDESVNFIGTATSAPRPSILKSLREALLPGMCVLTTLMFTLMVFPMPLSSIKPKVEDRTSKWKVDYMIPVLVFLSFNVCDYVGRLLCGVFKWPGRNRIGILLGLCSLRFVLVPLCLFLNFDRTNLPILFEHEGWAALFVIILGLSNGYLLSLSFIHAPSFASPGNSEGVGIAMCIYLSLGMSLGVAISYGLVSII